MLLDFAKKQLFFDHAAFQGGMTRPDYIEFWAFLRMKCDFLPDFEEKYKVHIF